MTKNRTFKNNSQRRILRETNSFVCAFCFSIVRGVEHLPNPFFLFVVPCPPVVLFVFFLGFWWLCFHSTTKLKMTVFLDGKAFCRAQKTPTHPKNRKRETTKWKGEVIWGPLRLASPLTFRSKWTNNHPARTQQRRKKTNDGEGIDDARPKSP